MKFLPLKRVPSRASTTFGIITLSCVSTPCSKQNTCEALSFHEHTLVHIMPKVNSGKAWTVV